MSWKVKEEYKDYQPASMSKPYGALKPHQIKNLGDKAKSKYFINTAKSKKKKVVKEIEEDLDFIGGNNGD